jgi:hypothetical protein
MLRTMNRSVASLTLLLALAACGASTASGDAGAPADSGATGGGSGGGGVGGGGGDVDAGHAEFSLDGGQVAVEFSGACTRASRCGGALQGKWVAASTCSPTVEVPAMLKANCPAATLTAASTLRGELQFDADRYTRTFEAQLTLHVVFPAACVPGGCAFAEGAFATRLPGVRCAEVGTDCDCTAPQRRVTSEQGTFQADGGALTLSPATGAAQTFDYCVAGPAFTWTDTADGGLGSATFQQVF